MEYKDIKVGAEYYVQVKVNGANLAKNAICVWDCGGHPCYFRLEDFFPISPENGTKNTESATKYAPCRRFRKGDRVELKEEVDGRKLSAFVTGLTLGKVYTVEEDEKDCTVVLRCDCGLGKYSFVHLRLVTPVEELDPYYIIDDDCNVEHPFFVIQNRNSKLSSGLDEEIMRFVYGQNYTADKETVLKRAKAECDRLNAEHRKELQ